MRFLPKVFLALFLAGFLVRPASAQDFDFSRAYQDYLYNFNQYQKAHQEYIGAKSAYQTYQTLTAKTEALEKTLKMLQWRDQTTRTYLTALRLKLAEATGISDYEQTVLYLKLDNEVSWYLDHHDLLSSSGTPEDLFKISKEAENQFPQSEILAYQALGVVLNGKVESFKQETQKQHDELKVKIAEIRQRGNKDTTVLERWLLEAENKLTLTQEKQFEAREIINKIELRNTKKIDKYTQARIKFKEAGQYLLEANRYLLEIIREVKLAD